jgi:hypothetical protein
MQAFSLDHLSETEFERFCFDLLIELKFLNVNWRKGTGLASSPSDRGRDIECQLLKDDVDGRQYFERWFVECKHYQQGVPTDRIQTALSWANSERPDTLLIIVSNFLSNATKDYLDNFIANNRPAFRIKYWEKPDIERLTLSKYYLLREAEKINHPGNLLDQR